ncbi:MAG: di-heme oxidoredictase family protein, partial [Myxococcota bacterium]|nr:di-heme oxidoredictase family protein [Myxococcota bacterium]
FDQGRSVFDFEFGFADGAGAPRFSGDSCRACHFEPVIGGAGPRGVNVVRHGSVSAGGEFVEPEVGSILHRNTAVLDTLNVPTGAADVFELRQTPALFGVGLIDAIPVEAILANADPEDANGDGVSGRAAYLEDGRLGRFGWKGQVPTVAEFARDGVSVELGMTVPHKDGMTFGKLQDDDGIPDPEMSLELLDALATYMTHLGPPPRQPGADSAEAVAGEAVFADVGCATCHVPALEGPDGPVPLYSDLLLHDILPAGSPGIEEAGASMTEFRTPPLWGVSQTGPWMHDGAADTFTQAIEAHAGEGAASVAAWRALDPTAQAALVAFLETL